MRHRRRRTTSPFSPRRRRRRHSAGGFEALDEANPKYKVPPKDTAPDFIEETYYTREKGAPSRGKEYTTVPEKDKPGLKQPGEIVLEAGRRLRPPRRRRRRAERRISNRNRFAARRRRRGGFDSDESVARELTMWVDNTEPIYRQKRSIEKNLTRKMSAGNYDHDLAVKAFMYVVESAAKDYAREFGGPGARWFEMFPKDIRLLAAEELRDDFEREVDVAPESYEEFVPKKYMKDWRTRYKQSSMRRRRRTAYYDVDKPVRMWSRRELEDYLEDRGFAVYDDDITEDLREAVEEDLAMEDY